MPSLPKAGLVHDLTPYPLPKAGLPHALIPKPPPHTRLASLAPSPLSPPLTDALPSPPCSMHIPSCLAP
eukprot:118500-Chlamydomonas_euryale.AAC.1